MTLDMGVHSKLWPRDTLWSSRHTKAKARTTAEYAQLEQRVRKVIPKQELDRDTLILELHDLLQAYRGTSTRPHVAVMR